MGNRTPAKPFHEFNLRMPNALYAHIRQHAFDRSVYMTELMNDVLQIWVYLITDPTDPSFSPERTGIELPRLPRERYLNYLTHLGFNIADLLEEPDVLRGRDYRPLAPTPAERTWES